MRFYQYIPVLICVLAVFLCLPGLPSFAAPAEESSQAAKTTTPAPATTTPRATTTTTTPKRTTPKPTTSSKTTSVYRSVKFKSNNPNTVNMLKSITLTIETTGFNSLDTKFWSSDTTLASVEKINNSNVKVIGLREGSVHIYAKCGDITAKFKVIVRTADGSPGVDALDVSSVPEEVLDTASGGPAVSEFVYDGPPVSEVDIFSSLTYDKTDPLTIILGIVAWGLLILGIMLVVTIILRNRSPRTNRFPGGSRNRYGKHHRRSRRLLPDHYYRNLKKW